MAKKNTVVIFGDRSTCSYCKKLAIIIANNALGELLPCADIIDADKTSNPKIYQTWRVKASFSGNYPGVAVFDCNGKLKGKFVARSTSVSPFTAANIAKKILAICPECCEEVTPPVVIPPTTTEVCSNCGFEVKFCPKCGKACCSE